MQTLGVMICLLLPLVTVSLCLVSALKHSCVNLTGGSPAPLRGEERAGASSCGASDSWHWVLTLTPTAPSLARYYQLGGKQYHQTQQWAQLWHLVTTEAAGAMPNTGDGGGKGKLDAAKRLGMSKHQGNINYEHVHSNSVKLLFWGMQCHVRIGMFKNNCE